MGTPALSNAGSYIAFTNGLKFKTMKVFNFFVLNSRNEGKLWMETTMLLEI